MTVKGWQHFAVKLHYGASHCVIRNVRVDGTGLAAVYVGGHSSPLRAYAADQNRVENIVARNVGRLLPRLLSLNPRIYAHAQPGSYVDGNNARWQPSRTYISGYASGFLPETMHTVGGCSSTGLGNVFDIDGDTFSPPFFTSSGAPVSVMRRGVAWAKT